MEQINEPETLQKLRFLLDSVNLIESCQNNLLITSEEKQDYIKSLNDKSHILIDKLILEI